MADSELDALWNFFGAVFHEDWCTEGACCAEVVSKFAEQTPDPEQLLCIASALRHLADEVLAAGTPDPDLEQRLYREFGCNYLFSVDGVSGSEWLNGMADQLRAAALARSS